MESLASGFGCSCAPCCGNDAGACPPGQDKLTLPESDEVADVTTQFPITELDDRWDPPQSSRGLQAQKTLEGIEEEESPQPVAGDVKAKGGSVTAGGYAATATVLVAVFAISAARGATAVCLYTGVLLILVLFGDLVYSRFIANLIFRLSDDEVTPAHQEVNKGHPDYVATPQFILFGHHWTSITGAAPIIGPALASYYGWLPAMLWVVLGSIFAGGVHDFGVLVVSARNGGRSIADLAGFVISWRARVLFLLLIMFLCWIVVAVFMNAIASLFIDNPQTVLAVNAEIPLAAIMGFASRFAVQRYRARVAKRLILVLSVVFLVILYVLVFVGVVVEETYGLWEDGKNIDPVFGWALHQGQGSSYFGVSICRDAVNYKRADGSPAEATCSFGAMQFWTIALTVYAFIVSVMPVWAVLQPRDFINSHQLKLCMFLLLLGLVIKGPSLDAEAMRSEISEKAASNTPIFPMLFTTIACGSVSGFHGLVSSGVSSKQLDRMRDSRAIGYSGMLGESALSALVIVICCSCGRWSSAYADWPSSWGVAFIPGASQLLEELGIGKSAADSIIIVLVVSFAATTLDSGMRIQRVLVGELGSIVEPRAPLLGKALQNIFVAGLISAVPACALANSRIVGSLWNLFGATNQLIACLSLVTVAIYVWRYHRFKFKYTLPFLFPAAWLGVFISWALVRTIARYLDPDARPDKVIDWFTTQPTYPSIIISFLILIFVAALVVEAGLYFVTKKYLRDAPVCQKTGKIEACPSSQSTSHMANLSCC